MEQSELDQEIIDDLFGELDDSLIALKTIADEIIQQETDHQPLDAVFRCVHSIKGNLRMVFLGELAEFIHDFETLLSAVREGTINAPRAFFPMVYLVMTELVELTKSFLNGVNIDEPFLALLVSTAKIEINNAQAMHNSSLKVINDLEPNDDSGYYNGCIISE